MAHTGKFNAHNSWHITNTSFRATLKLCSAASLRQLQLACVPSKVLISSQVGGTFSPATWSQFPRTWTIRNGTALIIISTQLPLLAIWHSGVVKSHPALQFWPWRGTECVIYSTRTGWNLRLCFKISLPIYQPRMRWKFLPFLLYYNFFCCIFFFYFFPSLQWILFMLLVRFFHFLVGKW